MFDLDPTLLREGLAHLGDPTLLDGQRADVRGAIVDGVFHLSSDEDCSRSNRMHPVTTIVSLPWCEACVASQRAYLTSDAVLSLQGAALAHRYLAGETVNVERAYHLVRRGNAPQMKAFARQIRTALVASQIKDVALERLQLVAERLANGGLSLPEAASGLVEALRGSTSVRRGECFFVVEAWEKSFTTLDVSERWENLAQSVSSWEMPERFGLFVGAEVEGHAMTLENLQAMWRARVALLLRHAFDAWEEELRRESEDLRLVLAGEERWDDDVAREMTKLATLWESWSVNESTLYHLPAKVSRYLTSRGGTVVHHLPANPEAALEVFDAVKSGPESNAAKVWRAACDTVRPR